MQKSCSASREQTSKTLIATSRTFISRSTGEHRAGQVSCDQDSRTLSPSTPRAPKRAIYILRDPRDVAVSYYRYLHGLGKYESDLDAFLADWLTCRIWPCSWREHVASWIGGSLKSTRDELLIIRYEDLIHDPQDHVRAIAQYLGYPLNRSRLNDVLVKTTSDEMRRKEKAGMRKSERANGFQFIGSAKAGSWRDSLSERQEALISESLGTVMGQFGYRAGCSEENRGSRSRAA